jgi:hypothetical protein
MMAHASATFCTGSHVRIYAVRLLSGSNCFGFFALPAEMAEGAGEVEFEEDSVELEASLMKCWRINDRHGARWRGLRTT